MKNLEWWKSRARPFALWTTSINLVVISAVTLILITMGIVDYRDAAGVLMAIIGAGGTGAAVYQYGRTQEKMAGNAVENMVDPEPPCTDGAF